MASDCQARAGLSQPKSSVCNRHNFLDVETVFNVRQKGYAKEKRKAPTHTPLFVPFASDLLHFEKKRDHIATSISLPELPEDMRSPINGVPPYLIVNVMLPRYDPPNPVWGHSKVDGPNWNYVFYLVMTKETQAALMDLSHASPAVQLLHDFMHDDSQQMRDRFKMMVYVANLSEVDVGSVVRKLVVDYNMKPLLTRPQHSFHTDGKTYFEVDIDVNLFGYMARKGFSSLREKMHQIILDIGFTIEGRDEAELPECLTCMLLLHKTSFSEAWTLEQLQQATKDQEEEEAKENM